MIQKEWCYSLTAAVAVVTVRAIGTWRKCPQAEGFATLLFDLLTSEEESVDQQTAQFRFDIELLAKRLVGVTQWITRSSSHPEFSDRLFRASSGAAAALVAAAQLPDWLPRWSLVEAGPTLPGDARGSSCAGPPDCWWRGQDSHCPKSSGAQQLHCGTKHLVVVPGATHLFEEAGALEKVAQVAADWFARICTRSTEPQSFRRMSGAR